MSDTNTIVFDQKTIDELEEYNPSTDGELTSQAVAQGTKFAVYLNQTGVSEPYRTLEKTKSINLKQMQQLLNLSNTEEDMIMGEEDLEQGSQNYEIPMLISPKVLKTGIKQSISVDEGLQQATRDASGLMSYTDKRKLDDLNIKNGSQSGSLRTTNSEFESALYTIGTNAFAEGFKTQATGLQSHAAGSNSIASGSNSYAGGQNTVAKGMNQTSIGKYNTIDQESKYALIIGNGENNLVRSNAMTVDWQGNIKIAGNIENSSNPTEDSHLTNKAYVDNKIETQVASIVTGSEIIDLIYPIGSFYFSANNTNPSVLFGGTWEQIKKKFLFAADDEDENEDYHAGEEGGEEEVTLTDLQSGLPEHDHTFISPETTGGIKGSVATSGMSANSSISGAFDIRLWGTGYVIEGSQNGVFNANNQVAKPSGNNNIPTSGTVDKKSAQRVKLSANISHTHIISDHVHTLTGGSVAPKKKDTGIESHNNMPPYLAVYIWKRTA